MKLMFFTHSFLTGFVILLLGMTAMDSSSQEGEQNPGMDFSAFQIIIERNIFNPEREKNVEEPEPEPVEEPAKTEELVLVGTLVTETNTYAFFEGTSTSFRRVLKAGDTIGGCTITSITVSNVTLQNEEQTLALKVGRALTRKEGESWSISDQARPTSLAQRDTSRESSSRERERQTESSSTDDSSTDDLLNKLMERRRQELEQ